MKNNRVKNRSGASGRIITERTVPNITADKKNRNEKKAAVNIYNISGFLNQYDLWQNLDKINGENALFIMDNKYMLNPVKKYTPYFKSIKKIGRLDIYVKFRPVRTYYLYLMKDFDAKKAIKRLNAKSRMY